MTIFSTRAFISASHRQETAYPSSTFSEQWVTNQWGDTSGRFVSSPWEGLRWEACLSPVLPSLVEPEELVGLDTFLGTLMYGE